jgi:hypothetical protein
VVRVDASRPAFEQVIGVIEAVLATALADAAVERCERIIEQLPDPFRGETALDRPSFR